MPPQKSQNYGSRANLMHHPTPILHCPSLLYPYPSYTAPSLLHCPPPTCTAPLPPALGVGETNVLKTSDKWTGNELGNGKEFETGNRQEMGNKTKFVTENGQKWETIR